MYQVKGEENSQGKGSENIYIFNKKKDKGIESVEGRKIQGKLKTRRSFSLECHEQRHKETGKQANSRSVFTSAGNNLPTA